jgi:acyl dehydratase
VGKRVNVTLDDEDAAKLSRLAERAHVSDGTLARSLLIGAIEEADPDPRTVTEILEGVPGLLDRVRAAEEQVERGEHSELSELA